MSTISQQQPVEVYPNTVTRQQPSSHSNGSFGTVFIVLAVIIVISAIACFLGRLCNRRYHNNPKPKVSHKQTQPQSHKFHPKEGDVEFGNQNQNQNQNRIVPDSHKFRIRPKDEDIEFGFDKMRNPKEGGIEFGFDKMSNPKGGGIEFGFDKRIPTGRPAGYGGIRGYKPSETGDVNKFAGGGEPKPSAYGAE